MVTIIMLDIYKQITIKTLHKQGVKPSAIVKQMGCCRQTVRNVLQREKIIEKQIRVKPSSFDFHKDQIKAWLDKEITSLRIHELLQENYNTQKTYSALRRYIQKQFPKPVDLFGVQVTGSGEEAELDFGYLGMLPGVNGKLIKTWGLVVVLSYSRLGYYAVCYDQKLETLIREVTNAFSYFGGVPKKLKIDNMRAAVLENQHYDLQFNQDFLEFTNHYGVVIIPCEPYSPQQKGKVESGIKYLQMNFVGGRTFTDDYDIATKLEDWMKNYANKRLHGTTKQVPLVVFHQEEKVKLQLLPDTPFLFFDKCIRKVAANCHIQLENNYYSVPYHYVGKDVILRWSKYEVRIIFAGEQVALHTRANGRGKFVTQRNHMPDYKVYSENERQAKYESKMAKIGIDAHEYFRWLLKQKENYWFAIIRGILGLARKYEIDTVNKALKRALLYEIKEVVTIRCILEKKLYL